MKRNLAQSLDGNLLASVRLAVIAVLCSAEWATFRFLKERTGATDGNLSVHLRKLEEAGYIKVRKRFVGRRPESSYRLTAAGRRALERHVAQIEKILEGRE